MLVVLLLLFVAFFASRVSNVRGLRIEFICLYVRSFVRSIALRIALRMRYAYALRIVGAVSCCNVHNVSTTFSTGLLVPSFACQPAAAVCFPGLDDAPDLC